MIVIGASKGGLSALRTLLAALPQDFPLPVAIVQHRATVTDSLLRDGAADKAAIQLVEVQPCQLPMSDT